MVRQHRPSQVPPFHQRYSRLFPLTLPAPQPCEGFSPASQPHIASLLITKECLNLRNCVSVVISLAGLCVSMTPSVTENALCGADVASVDVNTLEVLHISSLEEKEQLLSAIYREIHPPSSTSQELDSLLGTLMEWHHPLFRVLCLLFLRLQ